MERNKNRNPKSNIEGIEELFGKDVISTTNTNKLIEISSGHIKENPPTLTKIAETISLKIYEINSRTKNIVTI